MIPQHRTLAIAAAVLALAFAAVYAVVLYPQQRRLQTVRERKNALKSELSETNWPLDPQRLESLHSELTKEQKRFGTVSKQVMRQASQAFQENIARFTSGGPDEFRNVVSRLDYREEYSFIEREFQGRVHFDEAVLGLGESSDSIYVYQLLLQLWTVRSLTHLALDTGLEPAPHPTIKHYPAEGKPQPVSRISVQPMVAYSLREDDPKPYLLEFPVRLTLRGTIAELGRFLRGLQREGRFFPLRHVEIHKQVPPLRDRNYDRLEVTLECSSFFQLEDADARSMSTQTEKKLLPPGA